MGNASEEGKIWPSSAISYAHLFLNEKPHIGKEIKMNDFLKK